LVFLRRHASSHPSMSGDFLLIFVLAFSLSMLQIARATVETRTIDDQYGNSVTGALPIYSPNGWSYGLVCSTCYADQYFEMVQYVGLSLSNIYGGSWCVS
jgi:hypothetical protein